jgi:hypothetical protein
MPRPGAVPLAAALALVAALVRLAVQHPALLAGRPGWSARSDARQAEHHARAVIVVGVCAGWCSAGAAIARFARLYVKRDDKTARIESRLAPYPFDDRREAVVLGEMHAQEGAQVEHPRWLVVPFEGLFGNVICFGATGSAKTSGLAYPLTAQLLRIHADDPKRRLGGLVMDPKGNYCHYVREQMRLAGREEDYFEVSLGGDVVYNVLGRPDLHAPALAGHFFEAVKNFQGEGHQDPFWRQEAIDLATQAIRVIRLVTGREPTLQQIYRAATSSESFDGWLASAKQERDEAQVRLDTGEAREGDAALVEEYDSLEFWTKEKLAKLDPKLRSSISATLNGACSLFDVPVVRRTFAPTPEDCEGKRPFPGFREALASGQVVTVRIPGTQYKTVSNVVRTLMKLNFYDAVLERLSELRPGERPRPCLFVADEFDQITTQPADGDYLARAREACAINVVATQSYAALVARFKDQHAARQLLANLRTQVWLGVNDADSAEEASKLCGDVDRERSTHSRGESTEDASWSWLDGRLMGHKGGSNEGLSTTVHRERLFPPGVFNSLQKDQAIVRAFDGKRPLPPWVVYLKPYYEDPDVSWYEGKPANAGDVRLAVVREA